MIRQRQPNGTGRQKVPIAISILAGGLSSRMGREKARLRLGGCTVLGHVRRTAAALGVPVRIIRKDLVERSGPLGGILTSLKTSRAEAELFLACDMPFVSTMLLARLIRAFRIRRGALFAVDGGEAGFPFVIEAKLLPLVEQQIKAGRRSIQSLATVPGAVKWPVPEKLTPELFNMNTPDDWAAARAMFGRAIARPRAAGPLRKPPRASRSENSGQGPLVNRGPGS